MMKKNLIQDTILYVRVKFEKENSGHDWWHIYRVWKLALKIAKAENANLFYVEMAALLHDLDDWKLNIEGHQLNNAEKWMQKLEMQKEDIVAISKIIDEVSFKGAGVDTPASTIEAKIVQDADRLDAIGAIGIARTFSYGGCKNRLIYDPEIEPEQHIDFESYKNSNAPTVNHFYEKLLLLKDRMHTKTAKELAEKRHHFLEIYLKQFFNEWNLN